MAIKYDSPNCGEIELLMEPDEPAYIYGLLPDEGTLVEWGCGGSTIYFLDQLKPGQTLVSIEHNQNWYEKISETIANHPNIDQHVFLFIPPDGVANSYYARPEEEMPCGLEDYIVPDMDLIESADVFLVDGVARGPTAAFLARKAKDTAHVLIHDYKGRENWYHWAARCFDYEYIPDDMVLCHMSNTKIGD